MSDLAEYLDRIVEPTYEDFRRNPSSGRHAFLACVAAYHSIDRKARKPGNLRKAWGSNSMEFLIVDMIAHHFKHVESDYEKQPPPKNAIPLISVVFGKGGDPEAWGLDLYNLLPLIRDAIKFIRTQE